MEKIERGKKWQRLSLFFSLLILVLLTTMGAKCIPGGDDDNNDNTTSPLTLDVYFSMQTPGKEFDAGDLDEADPKYSASHTMGGTEGDWQWSTTDMSSNTTFVAKKDKIQDITELGLVVSWEHHSLTSTLARKSSGMKAPLPGAPDFAEVEEKCDKCHNQEPHAAPPHDPYFCGSACHHGAGGNFTYAYDSLYLDSVSVGTTVNDQAKAAYTGPADLWIDSYRTEKLYLGNPEYPGTSWTKNRRLSLQWYIAHQLNWCGFTADFWAKDANGNEVLVASGTIPANQRTGTVTIPATAAGLAALKYAIMQNNGLIQSKTKVSVNPASAVGASGARRAPYSYPYCVHFGVKLDMKIKSST
ncbi:MAG: hypothetical protein AB1498_06615 [bacterium]